MDIVASRAEYSTALTKPGDQAIVKHDNRQFDFAKKYEPRHEKTCLYYMRTTKAQSDQRLCCSLPRLHNTFSF